MSYSPTTPGVDEARLDGIVNTLTLAGNLTNLNTALTYDGLWTGATITSAMFQVGDPEDIPDVSVAPILVTVEAADNDGRIRQDTMSGLTYTNGTVHDLQTYINIYLQPQSLPAAQYVAKRERLIARLCDWATDGVLCSRTYQAITLTSSVFNQAPTKDVLRFSGMEVEKNYFSKSYGGNVRMRGARLTHYSYVG